MGELIRAIGRHPTPGVVCILLSSVLLFFWEALRLAGALQTTAWTVRRQRVAILAIASAAIGFLLMMIRFAVIWGLL